MNIFGKKMIHLFANEDCLKISFNLSGCSRYKFLWERHYELDNFYGYVRIIIFACTYKSKIRQIKCQIQHTKLMRSNIYI